MKEGRVIAYTSRKLRPLEENYITHDLELARCLECQQVKAKHWHLVGFLQLHALPKLKWEVISIDFIVGLPMKSTRHDSILVVVDTLKNSAHYVPIKITY